MAGHAGTVAFELVARVRSLAENTPETAEAQSKHQPHEVAVVPGTVHLVSAKRPRDEHHSRSLAKKVQRLLWPCNGVLPFTTAAR